MRSPFHLNALFFAARTTCHGTEHHPDQHPCERGGETSSSLRQIKNPQGLSETLRIAPASSSSPVPQPSREQKSTFRAGLLARGSPYSPRLPIPNVKRRSSFMKRRWKPISYEIRFTRYVSCTQNSGNHGFRPHSQRRDREGFAPSSLTWKSQYPRHNRKEEQYLSSSIMFDLVHSVQPLGRRGDWLDVKLEVEQGV